MRHGPLTPGHGPQAYFTAKDTGVLHEKVPGAVNPMSNPMGMMEMMKGQAYFMMTQMGMMQFAEMFFSGFVLGESPTPPRPD
jgi:hypothetical protein